MTAAADAALSQVSWQPIPKPIFPRIDRCKNSTAGRTDSALSGVTADDNRSVHPCMAPMSPPLEHPRPESHSIYALLEENASIQTMTLFFSIIQ